MGLPSKFEDLGDSRRSRIDGLEMPRGRTITQLGCIFSTTFAVEVADRDCIY